MDTMDLQENVFCVSCELRLVKLFSYLDSACSL